MIAKKGEKKLNFGEGLFLEEEELPEDRVDEEAQIIEPPQQLKGGMKDRFSMGGFMKEVDDDDELAKLKQ